MKLVKEFSKKLPLALSVGIFCWVNSLAGDNQAFIPALSMLESTSDGAGVWQMFDTEYRVEGATFVNGNWSDPVLLSDTLTNNFFAPVISRVNAGNAVALWAYHNGSTYLVTGSRMTNFIWSQSPDAVTTDQDAGFDDIQVRLDNSNNMSAIWTSQKLDSNVIIRGATGTISGGWNSPFQISP